MTRAATVAAGALLLLLLGVPIASLILRVPAASLAARLAEPTIQEALRLSLFTTLISTVVIALLGTPVAYVLATRSFPGKRVIETLIDLPMVLPPTVAGLALLLAFGRAGLVGKALGVALPFTTLAVILAQVFMAAPFFIAPARAGFASLDRRLLDAAATLRASEGYTFRRVVLPLTLPSLTAGAAMACARALGEFGATIMFAGNMPGVTQTMPLAVYVAFESDLEAAIVLSVLLMILSFALLFGLRAASGRMGPASGLAAPIAR